MATDDQPTTPLPAHDAESPAPAAAALPAGETAPAEPRQRFTQRLWGFRAMIAVALAAVLLGGAGGAALASVSKGGQDGRGGFGGHGPGGFGGPGTDPRMGPGPGRGHGQPWQDNGGQQGPGPTPAPTPSTTS